MYCEEMQTQNLTEWRPDSGRWWAGSGPHRIYISVSET